MKKSVLSDKDFWYFFGDPDGSKTKKNCNMCHVILAISLFLLTSTVITFTLYKIQKLENDIEELTNSINTLRKIIDEKGPIGVYTQETFRIDDEYDGKEPTMLPSLNDENIFNDEEELGENYDDYEEYEYKDVENNNNNNNNSNPNVVITADQYTKDTIRKRSIVDRVPDNYEIDEEDRNKSSRISTNPPSVQSRQNLWRPISPYHRKSKKLNNQQNTDAESVEFRVERDEHRRRNVEGFEPQPRTGRMRPLPTVHFSGDTSRYGIHHSNYRGNGHLRHLQKTFIDWKESDWVRNLGMDQHFIMEDGKLTIKETGLYFVYAQIYYLDVYDSNGFTVKKNSETLLQCTVTFHSRERDYVGNTCYTAGAEYLMEGDVISLRDLSEGRYTIFSPARSFFGVIKLGDIKM